MNEERDEHERADRDRERSEEAHWRTAEAGVEEESRPSEDSRRPPDREDDWENEGGALDREPAEGSGGPRQD